MLLLCKGPTPALVSLTDQPSHQLETTEEVKNIYILSKLDGTAVSFP